MEKPIAGQEQTQENLLDRSDCHFDERGRCLSLGGSKGAGKKGLDKSGVRRIC